MAITDKEQGVWETDQVYNKIMEGNIWSYTGADAFFVWGDNDGQLGLNDKVDYSSPVQLPGTWSNPVHDNMGIDFSGGFKSDGSYWTMGKNGDGQLGHNDTTQRSSPIQLPGTWSNASMGGDNGKSCIAVKTDGTLWCWGGNNHGQLGQNNKTDYSSPKTVGSEETWKMGSAGADYMLAVKTDGTLWSLGYNEYYGMLGQGNRTDYSSPRQVGTNTNWAFAHAGRPGESIAVKTDGTLWAWGSNTNGQLGQNGPTGPGYSGRYSSPRQIGTDTDWAYEKFNKITVGSNRMGAVKQDGTLWMWGYNSNGQLGQNNQTRYSSPVQVGSGQDWEYVSTGQYHTMAKKTDGTLWSWGYNGQGELGQNQEGPSASYSSPIQVPGSWGTGERKFVAAYFSSYAMGKL